MVVCTVLQARLEFVWLINNMSVLYVITHYTIAGSMPEFLNSRWDIYKYLHDYNEAVDEDTEDNIMSVL
jgi:hypothetical protein